MEDHISATVRDRSATRAVVAREFGHLAPFMSRSSFDRIVDDATLTRFRADHHLDEDHGKRATG